MACDCNVYIDCGSPSMEINTYDDGGTATHEMYSNVLTDNLMGFISKMSRTFSISRSWDRAVSVSHIVSGCGETYMSCDSTSSATPSASIAETCKIEKNIPYFWDSVHNIFVWKHVSEVINFGVSSNKTAAFRTKWGNSHFHKLCIPNTVKTSGIEEFIMVKNGVRTVLSSVSYTYNPFPPVEAQGIWGLYGNVITKPVKPDTEDVACIILVPNPPSLATPLDNDVLYYGFYDYNAKDGGFVETSLPADDGGKDYFYPYWCRQMPLDELWRRTADDRYVVIYSQGLSDLSGSTQIGPVSIETNQFPFGSFTIDSKSNFVASCVLPIRGGTVVYNESSIGDLIASLRQLGVPMTGAYSTLFPITPLC